MNYQFIKKPTFFLAVSVLVFSCFNVFIKPAAAVETGDLVKTSISDTVYYIGENGKRYVFPHRSVYETWYKDFSNVKTISLSELNIYPLADNMTVRPGTKLIKIQSDPSVYAVSPGGILHKIDSETRAVTLYGTDWAKRVIDVSDAFFVNYRIGTPIISDLHPDGTLIQYVVLPDTKFLIDNGKKRSFANEAAFNENGYWEENIITTTLNYNGGSEITAEEKELTSQLNTLVPEETPVKKEVAQITATANYTQIAANGQAKAVIAVTLKDNNGQVVTDASEPVTLSSDTSLGTTLSTYSAVPSAGIAQAILTAGYKTGTIEVVASLGSLSKTIQISVVSVELLQPGVTIMNDPSLVAPFKDSAGPNEEYTLTWTKIENVSIDYYIVEEATNSTFTEGLTQYTVNTNSIILKHSYPQTIKYFYRVKGVHNTVEGLWNNTLHADNGPVTHEVIGTDV